MLSYISFWDIHIILSFYHILHYITISGWWLSHPSEKYESQLGVFFPIYGKMKNVPNHQPNIISHQIRIWLLRLDIAAHLEGLSHGPRPWLHWPSRSCGRRLRPWHHGWGDSQCSDTDCLECSLVNPQALHWKTIAILVETENRPFCNIFDV